MAPQLLVQPGLESPGFPLPRPGRPLRDGLWTGPFVAVSRLAAASAVLSPACKKEDSLSPFVASSRDSCPFSVAYVLYHCDVS